MFIYAGKSIILMPGITKRRKTMLKIKRSLSLILALFMLLSLALPLASCTGNGGEEPSGSESGTGALETPDGKVEYTVTLRSEGGLVFDGVMVYIYNEEEYIVGKAETDENGKAVFTLPKSAAYTIELSGSDIPKGYILQDRYPMGESGAVITLTSKVIEDSDLTGVNYKVGMIMHDFEATLSDGSTFKLSEVLKEKKMVLINFWYATCTYCIEEFPAMNSAYINNRENIEIIALNAYSADSEATVRDFKQNYYDTPLEFPMAKDPGGVQDAFNVPGNPVSIVVDRYGMISLYHVGPINERQFNKIFEHFSADNYTQKTYNDVTELVERLKPDVEMPSSEELSAVLNKGDINVTYTPELEANDAEYSWPFKIAEKNGEACIFPANSGIENSFATLHAKVELDAGEAFVFDYLVSTGDIFYVLVDGDDIYQITGEEEAFKECCPWVADEKGVYDVVFLYNKGDVSKLGDDGVYLKNFRVVPASEVNAPSYIPREAATAPTEDGTDYTKYVNVVLNPADGYYHVESENGPILLAKLIFGSRFSDVSVAETLYEYEADGFMVDGVDCFAAFNKYCNYAANSRLYMYCSVNEELAKYLKAYAQKYGFKPHENTWLQLCSYYDVYGKNEDGTPAAQLEDPIKGLSTHSSYTAQLGENKVTYNGVSMIPRGYLYKFVPTESGVYRITSKNTDQELIGWIFTGNDADWTANGDRILYLESDTGERVCEDLIIKDSEGNTKYDSYNVSMAAYMEAGKEYYIDIAYSEIYGAGTFSFDIKYVAPTFDYFIMASPGPFTYELGPTGNAGDTIVDGIDVMLGEDGYYYHKKADGTQGSLLYADFLMTTSVFTRDSLTDMIDKGGFNFSLSELDHEAVSIWETAGRSEDALKAKWGAEFDKYWAMYGMDDIVKGRYHGEGEDLTEEMRTYVQKMLDEEDHPERVGCVPVDKRLAELLQMLMDKYTFKDVDHSWIKVCYYYDYLGR